MPLTLDDLDAITYPPSVLLYGDTQPFATICASPLLCELYCAAATGDDAADAALTDALKDTDVLPSDIDTAIEWARGWGNAPNALDARGFAFSHAVNRARLRHRQERESCQR